jgi:endonuclease YncB( thermonuclease family)
MRPFCGPAQVVDGDTIVVGRTRVRLFGVDAPEMSQNGGWAAKHHLAGLIGAAEVEVFPRAIDVYGRTVARTRCGGRDLSKEMVRDGFARSTPSWSLAYAATELGARWRGRGLWARSRWWGIGNPARHRRRTSGRARR